ncbi:protein SSUH2 [Carex littledalei]|uniref:Protein SSUH2 n=1 Tax=Carex littledalei TaxID=544730 RepID=A0A833VL54_9POAL|nr:protein SSUH2 [Carex littledalei]
MPGDGAAAAASNSDDRMESSRSYEYYTRVPTGEEVRLGSKFSETDNDRFSCYPPSLHGALVGSPESDPPHLPFPHASSPSNDLSQEGFVYQGGHNNYQSGDPSRQIGSWVLDEVEIRQLLINHVGHKCCWGSAPARRWKITSIEQCFAYVGTLETFIEKRETVIEKEPYFGGEIDGRDKGKQLGLWELDLRVDFPQLFIPEKKVRIKIPHSEAVQRCDDCNSRGETTCAFCHGMMQMTMCPECHGAGLVKDQDDSDTICTMCMGKGMQECASCNSRGIVKCMACAGHGSLLTRSIAVVRWETLYTKKVSTTSIAASVPDEVFHKARGVQLCNIQAYQCQPAFFADSYHLNNFSSEVIASRASVPPSARVITERHIISFLPVTRVIMAHQKRSFSFYIVGYNWDIFVRDYPARFCWGLCCCFEWLNM